MKLPRLIVLASVTLGRLATGRAADATTPVDYAERNGDFAPTASVSPATTAPSPGPVMEERRVQPAVVARQPSVLGDRRAAVDVQETREKNVIEKNSYRPTALEQTMSSFNHREASLTTGGVTQKPERVARYQDSLAAASAANLARFPAASRVTTAKINRFVFRKNAPDPASALDPAAPSAAVKAGGSPPTK